MTAETEYKEFISELLRSVFNEQTARLCGMETEYGEVKLSSGTKRGIKIQTSESVIFNGNRAVALLQLLRDHIKFIAARCVQTEWDINDSVGIYHIGSGITTEYDVLFIDDKIIGIADLQTAITVDKAATIGLLRSQFVQKLAESGVTVNMQSGAVENSMLSPVSTQIIKFPPLEGKDTVSFAQKRASEILVFNEVIKPAIAQGAKLRQIPANHSIELSGRITCELGFDSESKAREFIQKLQPYERNVEGNTIFADMHMQEITLRQSGDLSIVSFNIGYNAVESEIPLVGTERLAARR